jgi:hypothetical protein
MEPAQAADEIAPGPQQGQQFATAGMRPFEEDAVGLHHRQMV